MGFLASPTSRGFNGFQAYQGGHAVFQLTPAMGTAPQLVKAGGGRICRIWNPQGGTATITVYDAEQADADTLSTAVVLYAGTLPTTAGVSVDLQLPVDNGIVVEASPAVDDVVLVAYV
jgi:hypothetical protein